MVILNNMAKYIPDIKSRRWVILAPGRFGKPSASNSDYSIYTKGGRKVAKECPFCPGNEDKTPPEIESLKKGDEWRVRVFGNRFPITDIHEVVVHSPDHCCDLEDFSDQQLLRLFKIYQNRLRALSDKGVAILFRNYGITAGTSLPHPHSQIIVLPQQINLESLYLEPVKNLVYENKYFVLYCPDFSQYPYEVWITHKDCSKYEIGAPELQEIKLTGFNDEELLDLAKLLQKTLKGLEKNLGKFDYNYYIAPKPPFYLRLIPRLITRGGFELGTGLSTNTLDPAEAAADLQKVIK